MSVSSGNLDSLLNVTFSVDSGQYAGGSIQSYTLTPAPSFIPTELTVTTTGTPGAGAVTNEGETFTVVAVHDATNSLTVAYGVGGTVLGEVPEYVIGYSANAILVGFELTPQSIGEGLFTGGDDDDLVTVLTPTRLATGTTLDFTSDATFTAPLCFLPGTLIATPAGDTPIERLAAGDMVLTLNGVQRRIVWIGEGRVLATRGRRNAATPVIIRRHALGECVPSRDLRVTKAHSLYIDDMLIPVEFLVNHRSIIWDDHAQEVHLFHIELATHDVLIANGAPAESYRDDGNRWLFGNVNSGWDGPPQKPCAPVLTGGEAVDAVWRRLLERSGPRRGVPLTREPILHLLVDGTRINPTHGQDGAYLFALPGTPTAVRIVSRAAAPQELGIARDPRFLGIAIRNITVRQGSRFVTIDAANETFTDGFHDFESDNGIRWTDGDAVLPPEIFAGFTGPLECVLQLGGETCYIDDGTSSVAA